MKVEEEVKCGIKYQADIIRIGYRAYKNIGDGGQEIYRGMWSKINSAIKTLLAHRLQ